MAREQRKPVEEPEIFGLKKAIRLLILETLKLIPPPNNIIIISEKTFFKRECLLFKL